MERVYHGNKPRFRTGGSRKPVTETLGRSKRQQQSLGDWLAGTTGAEARLVTVIDALHHMRLGKFISSSCTWLVSLLLEVILDVELT